MLIVLTTIPKVFLKKATSLTDILLYNGLEIQETYELSTNDSTRNLWQQLRDNLEKELDAWPNCPVLGDDHKVAKFETEGGFITVTLKNTYTPTLNVLYQTK